MSDFWQKYLTVWCVGVVLFGIGLYGGGYAATDGFNTFFYELVNSNDNALFYVLVLVPILKSGVLKG